MKRTAYHDTITADTGRVVLSGQNETLTIAISSWIGEHSVMLTEDGIRNLIDGLEKYLACRVA